jgi:hypothetical protein
MPSVPLQYDRGAMPVGAAQTNPEMAQQISESAVFGAIASELKHQRIVQAMRYNYTYVLNDDIDGQVTEPFYMTIEQGTDFQSLWLTASAYSYETDQGDASSFPIPNSMGLLNWAGRGLSLMVTDMRSGRELTSGYVPFELIGTPGYGMNFQHPYPFKYLFYRNSKIRIDVRNRDNADRNHEFSIALNGYKIMTPE